MCGEHAGLGSKACMQGINPPTQHGLGQFGCFEGRLRTGAVV
jgi:hypothetical protein